MKLKSAIAIILLSQILAFRSDYKIDTEYFYNLTKIREASPPREVEMVKIDNLSRGDSVVSRGVLFSYKNRDARQVLVAGNFSQWRGLKMLKNSHGIWYYFLGEHKTTKKLEYKFCVNGTWISDPVNPIRRDDGFGSYISIASPAFSEEGKNVTYRLIGKKTVEFRVFMPGARMISLVGDFNNWNPENDLMEKGDDGIWRLVKKITPGTHRYKYVIDGEWRVDLYNSASASDTAGDICSVIVIK